MRQMLKCAMLGTVGCALLAISPAVAAPQTGCNAGTARYDVRVPGRPFAVAAMPDGQSAFVSLNSPNPITRTGIGVLRCSGGRFRYSRLIAFEPQPTGMALTHDGKVLVVADDGFVVFLDARAALAGKPAILGYLQDLPGDVEDNDAGSVYANVSPDDRYAFISDEQNLTVTVIDLAKAQHSGYNAGAIIGQIPVANAPVALSFSLDGRYLFTTSQVARKAYGWPAACKPEGSDPGTPLSNPAGAVITIDVKAAAASPGSAVVGKVPADCSPVRMALSPDGATAWVTNRASNSVTAFSTGALIVGSSDARIATIPVGSNPVAIAATTDGRYVLAANTNRFGQGGTTDGTISVIDARTHAVVGTLPAGRFPREFSRGRGSTLFLANNRSSTVTVFDTSRLSELLRS